MHPACAGKSLHPCTSTNSYESSSAHSRDSPTARSAPVQLIARYLVLSGLVRLEKKLLTLARNPSPSIGLVASVTASSGNSFSW